MHTTQTYLVIARAFYVKCCETDVLLQQVKTSLALGAFIGYFIWKLGMKLDYLMDLIGSPYNEIAALSANMWLLMAVLFGQQVRSCGETRRAGVALHVLCLRVCLSLSLTLSLSLSVSLSVSAPSSQALNVHIICQKIKLFRYEQRVKACPTFAFWFATLCSELPFAIGTSLIAANLIYFMCELNVGLHNWLFFVGVVSCVAAVGNTVAIALAAVIRKEMIVRDLFLLFAFLMTISNGYLFHYDKSKPYIEKVIVCARHASVVETATYAHTQTHRLTHRLTHTHTHRHQQYDSRLSVCVG